MPPPIIFSLLFILLSPLPTLPTAHTTTEEYLKLPLLHIKHSKSPSNSLLLDLRRVSSLHRRLKSPLISGAASGSGQYFAGISIGTPPQRLLLVADTGSDLTWVKCSACRRRCSAHHPPGSAFLARHSSSFSPSHCFDSACQLVPHPSHSHCNRTTRVHTPCLYSYSYTDGSLTSGIFSQETTSLNSTSGKEFHIPGLRFGCGFHISGPSFQSATGVMGLGRGPISFSTQLGHRFGNKFSYCLMDYTLSPPPTSYLVIGGVSRNNHLQSTPLITSSLSPTFYYVGIKAVIINGQKLPISSSVWDLDDLGNGGTIIDSGTTLSFVPYPAYREILSVMRKRVRLPRLSESTPGFDLCYNVSGVIRPSLPRMSFLLVGGSVFDPPPGNYFVDTEADVKCLALQAVNSPSGFSVIGNLMQQGFLFEFDNGSSRLSFSRNGCGNMS